MRLAKYFMVILIKCTGYSYKITSLKLLNFIHVLPEQHWTIIQWREFFLL